ncbi:hypothetical protein FEK35_16500 [Nocardia cyriacigeorgica]|uniref:SCP2 sterol-binding domain-containing protein n=1 Tax=Nocardia cyriacigeorgica TaxID=135487 RepID=A0A5R8PBY9_9NOCA|nr:hypothetical protein [Nocardia cyriacigeorgica]TLG08782.1 hypothetical protein FEK35_16500 [Nocardia cyriacigeorgica]
MLNDPEVVAKAKAVDRTLHLILTKPDIEFFVTHDGVIPGPDGRKEIKVKMSCDTGHVLWTGDLLVPLALATGRVRIKGNVAKVLEFVPVLRPAFDVYSTIAASHGVAA